VSDKMHILRRTLRMRVTLGEADVAETKRSKRLEMEDSTDF
jgi:hypothetical protein